jgi:hypothetical protein
MGGELGERMWTSSMENHVSGSAQHTGLEVWPAPTDNSAPESAQRTDSESVTTPSPESFLGYDAGSSEASDPVVTAAPTDSTADIRPRTRLQKGI